MAGEFQVSGHNAAAPFTLTLHRGDGMVLLGMNWQGGPPPPDFVGFAIEYKEPGGDRFFAVKNRLSFAGADAEAAGKVNPGRVSTRRAHRSKSSAGSISRSTPSFPASLSTGSARSL